jgi:hypothetical protein
MKHINIFNSFFSDTVNLNQTRFNQLNNSVAAIQKYISNSTWQPNIHSYLAQGSWAHKTIIKPLPGKPFDADYLVYVEPVDEWEAKDYIDQLYNIFLSSDIYNTKVSRYSHCVTIEYANERKIDIAPCIKNRKYADTYEVCNKFSNEFEESRPNDYTKWLTEKDRITKNNNLRKVTRLIKYIRDIKKTFTCPSFLLTTLIGEQVNGSDEFLETFIDVPTTLKVIINRLDDWLQANEILPEVRNPVLYSEIQSTAWDQNKYSNFRTVINRYRDWVDDAYLEDDRDESIGKWRRIFGDDFAKNEVIEKASRISTIALESTEYIGSYFSDLVEGVKLLGLRALPKGFNRLSHMERPIWKKANDLFFEVKIKASFHSAFKCEASISNIQSLLPLRPGNWLKFIALGPGNLPFPDTYSIKWRITNTDVAATNANSLRGDFYPSQTHGERWEQLLYRGVHMVEAFLIRKFDDRQIGASSVFYVVIE